MNIVSESAKIYKGVDIRNTTVGDSSVIADNVFIANSILSEKVEIGRRCFVKQSTFDFGSYIGHDTSVLYGDIGKYCSISWGVSIVGGGMHNAERLSTYTDYWWNRTLGTGIVEVLPKSRTSIGNDVWIGCNAVVLDGIHVGDGAIIGAGAVVTKDVPAYSVVAGNPAKEIKKRFSQEVIDKLMDVQWWNISPDILAENKDILTCQLNENTLIRLMQLRNMQK